MAKKKPKTPEQKRKEERAQEKKEEEKLILVLQEHKADQEIEVYKLNEIQFKKTQEEQLKKINRHMRRIKKKELTVESLAAFDLKIRGKSIKVIRDFEDAVSNVDYLKKIKEPVITADMEGVAPAPKPKEEEEIE
jgi:hypothetical protein